MSAYLFFDYETRSILDLEVRGLACYAEDPSTSLLLCAYALDDDPIQLWDASSGAPIPKELLDDLCDPFTIKVAWNAGFERAISRCCLKLDIPLSEWLDPMVWSRHLSLPGKLEKVAPILNLKSHKITKADGEAMVKSGGKDLIRLFCEPSHGGGKETLFGTTEPWFCDKSSNPREWEEFGKYVMADVETMREAFRHLKAFPLPAFEQGLWEISERINERGWPVDMELVTGAAKVAEIEKTELAAELQQLTGVENPNSEKQLKGYLKTQGYTFTSIGKPFVNRALAGELVELTETGKRVLQLRQQLAKTTSNKLTAIRDRVSNDGRLRYQYSFMGAARTGRWSGGGEEGAGGVQMQNLLRPTKEVSKKLDDAIAWLKAADHARIKREFGSVLDVVGSCVRSVFAAPPGYHFAVSDLSAIENRGLGYLCMEDKILKVFRDGRDPYIDFASRMFKIPYEKMVDEKGKCLPEYAWMRQIAKPAVLGAGYRLSGGEERETKDGDKYRSGLWGYALAMGVDMTQKESHDAVAFYRKEYTKVKESWYVLEKIAVAAVRSGQPQKWNHITFVATGSDMLRVILPSGRALHYVQPEIQKTVYTSRSGEEYEKEVVSYMGVNSETHQWDRIGTHGGKWVENITQAFARDILAHGMRLAERHGFEVVGHTHDELVALVPDESPLKLPHLNECLATSPSWAPDLPLAAEGYTDKVYRKE